MGGRECWADWAVGEARPMGERRQAEDLPRRLLLVFTKPPTCLHNHHRAQLSSVSVAGKSCQKLEYPEGENLHEKQNERKISHITPRNTFTIIAPGEFQAC